MENKHRTILRDNRPNIVKDLEPNNILPDLGSVLTPKDDADIKAQSTRQERCEQLLEIIPRKGPNAFKVFVEALKKEVPHLADDLIEADELKTKLEAEKQNHPKTSQELEELKNLHETSETSQQIQKLAEIVQQLTADDSSSPCEALRNLRDSTERETQSSEIQELTKGITKMVEGYRSLQKEHGNLIQELEKAKKLLEDHDKSKEEALKLKKKLEKSQRDLANKNKWVKECQEQLQAKSNSIDDLRRKLKNAMENKSLQKKLSQEEGSEFLQKEVELPRLRLPQIYLPTNYGKPVLDTGRRYELLRLPELNSHARVRARELLPREFAAMFTSRTPFKDLYVENSPSCLLGNFWQFQH